MRLSRREFLVALAGATAAAAGLGLPVVYQYVNQTRQLSLPDVPPGRLDTASLRTLRAATEAIFIAYPVDLDRYTAFFTFHAENIAGYAAIYTGFTQELDRSARWSYRRSFANCSIADRRGVLAAWFDIPETREERLLASATRGITWMRFSQYVVTEILTLFMNTDAWIMVGYEAWPGMPRGLDTYRQPPQPTSPSS